MRRHVSRSACWITGPASKTSWPSHLFHPLTTSKQDGLGLGLSICASIVEAHGGRVWLHSGERGATEFRFSVPLDQSRKRVTMAAPTIFVIDDQQSVRDALGEMLSVFGYSVKTYELADAFLAAVGKREPGCIVADVRMPGTDGIELVRELASTQCRDARRSDLRSRRRADGGGRNQIRSAKTLSKSRSTTPNSLRRSTARSPGASNSRISKNRKARSARGLRG